MQSRETEYYGTAVLEMNRPRVFSKVHLLDLALLALGLALVARWLVTISTEITLRQLIATGRVQPRGYSERQVDLAPVILWPLRSF